VRRWLCIKVVLLVGLLRVIEDMQWLCIKVVLFLGLLHVLQDSPCGHGEQRWRKLGCSGRKLVCTACLPGQQVVHVHLPRRQVDRVPRRRQHNAEQVVDQKRVVLTAHAEREITGEEELETSQKLRHKAWHLLFLYPALRARLGAVRGADERGADVRRAGPHSCRLLAVCTHAAGPLEHAADDFEAFHEDYLAPFQRLHVETQRFCIQAPRYRKQRCAQDCMQHQEIRVGASAVGGHDIFQLFKTPRFHKALGVFWPGYKMEVEELEDSCHTRGVDAARQDMEHEPSR
jgi:hypothetical protein